MKTVLIYYKNINEIIEVETHTTVNVFRIFSDTWKPIPIGILNVAH